MSTSKSGIEWTDRTWNPVRGCFPVSDTPMLPGRSDLFDLCVEGDEE